MDGVVRETSPELLRSPDVVPRDDLLHSTLDHDTSCTDAPNTNEDPFRSSFLGLRSIIFASFHSE